MINFNDRHVVICDRHGFGYPAPRVKGTIKFCGECGHAVQVSDSSFRSFQEKGVDLVKEPPLFVCGQCAAVIMRQSVEPVKVEDLTAEQLQELCDVNPIIAIDYLSRFKGKPDMLNKYVQQIFGGG